MASHTGDAPRVGVAQIVARSRFFRDSRGKKHSKDRCFFAPRKPKTRVFIFLSLVAKIPVFTVFFLPAPWYYAVFSMLGRRGVCPDIILFCTRSCRPLPFLASWLVEGAIRSLCSCRPLSCLASLLVGGQNVFMCVCVGVSVCSCRPLSCLALWSVGGGQ